MSSSVNLDVSDVCAVCSKRANGMIEQKFSVNTLSGCGHKFCSDCVDKKFYKAVYFMCPICNSKVMRDKLSKKSLEEVVFERDGAIRREIKQVYNKVENDFRTKEEFRNYEEQVEDIIYNLVHDINVAETNQKVKAYEQENIRLIAMNQTRSRERNQLEMSEIQNEESLRAKKQADFEAKVRAEVMMKADLKRLQDSLALGDEDALKRIGASQTDSSAPVATGSAPLVEMSLNPVVAFLNQRPEPKTIETIAKSSNDGGGRDSNDRKRKVHQAGGYDYSYVDRRNWNEIRRMAREI